MVRPQLRFFVFLLVMILSVFSIAMPIAAEKEVATYNPLTGVV